MSSWCLRFVRDRGQEMDHGGVEGPAQAEGTAPMGGRWGHLVAYLDGWAPIPTPRSSLEAEAEWLTRRSNQLLDSTLINSDELNRWSG